MMNNIEQINDFEIRYNLIIPNHYKEFLQIKNGISFNEQLVQENIDLMNEHDEIQKLQSHDMRRK